MIHSFDIDDAKKYGMTEAVILYNLRFWIEKNKANDKHFYEGRYWTYNSVKAFEELFPYLTYRNIRSAIENLQKNNVIITGNFNVSSYDRTRWFALFDVSELTNGIAKPDKTVNTDSNTNKKQLTINEFIKLCKEKNEKPIKDFKGLWEYVKDSQLPEEYILICWHYFIDNYKDTDKKYKDWRLAFLKCVKGNWFKLWAINKEGQYFLTSTGQQTENYLNNRG